MKRESLKDGVSSMWRYRALLSVDEDVRPVTLGEGMTPLTYCPRLALYIKDEGQNPAGTHEARGASYAISMLKGDALTTRSAAVAVYGAAAGKRVEAVLPFDAPQSDYLLCKAAGARVRFSDDVPDEDSPRRPFLAEAGKTIAFEIVEQLGWQVPGTIVFSIDEAPLRNGFDEMEKLGWIDARRPKFLRAGEIPKRQAIAAALELTSLTGIYAAPDAGACLVALRQHSLDQPVVLINPASGLRYAEAFSTQFARNIETDRDRLGGLITPR